MAIVSIRWSKNADAHLKYVQKERGELDVTHVSDCRLEFAAEDFENVRNEHRKTGGNQTLHVVQSFSPEDSKRLTPEQFNAMGRKLAEEMFKGHQFVIRTHTDQPHFHNHIVVNTVSAETGKKIENKKRLIEDLRTVSDKICLENGLSVLNREARERRAKVPFQVHQMVRAGKQSWVYDIAEKANFARSYSTSFDEYTAILSEMSIYARIENKNITYFYPGKEKGKRGSTMGYWFDKEGLQKSFMENDQRFAAHPELRGVLQEEMERKAKAVENKTAGATDDFPRNKDYSQFTKTPRGHDTYRNHSDRELINTLIPLSELKKARERSIPDYCERNKIGLKKNEHGQTVLRGREHVVINEYDIQNTRNGTTGSLIDLVAIHRNMTFVQAVAHINSNPRLLLLEKYMGTVTRKYQSFYVPKPERASSQTAIEVLNQFVQSVGGRAKLTSQLQEKNLAQVDRTCLLAVPSQLRRLDFRVCLSFV